MQRLTDERLRQIVAEADRYDRWFETNTDPRPADSNVVAATGAELSYVMRTKLPNNYGGPAKYEQIWEVYAAWHGHTFKVPVELRSYHLTKGQTVWARLITEPRGAQKTWIVPKHGDPPWDTIADDPLQAAKDHIAASLQVEMQLGE